MKNIKKSYNTFTQKHKFDIIDKKCRRVICMIERIAKLTELTLNGDMFVETVKTEFDREDLFLPKSEMEVKRICEYILNQQPKITKYSKMTGFFRFDGSVVGDAFGR